MNPIAKAFVSKPLFLVAALGLSAQAQAVPVTYIANPNANIPDPGSVNSTITVSDPGTLLGLTVTVAINHPWANDVSITLTAPNAQTITVMAQPGSGSENSDFSASIPITFDDAASVAAASIGAGGSCGNGAVIGSAACDGITSFIPTQALSTFYGQSITGNWVLRVTDNDAIMAGSFSSWSLNMDVPATNNGGSSVPEIDALAGTGALTLLGFGLALAGERRRRA